MVLVLAIGLLAGILWVYARDTKTLPLRVRISLATLRVLAVGIVLIFLSQCALSIDRTGLPVIVVMIDDSASMSLDDLYTNEEIQRAVEELLKDVDQSQLNRFELATTVLTRDNGDWLRDLSQQYKVQLYRFSNELVPIGQSKVVSELEVEQIIAELKRIQPRGSTTRPGPVVAELLNQFRGAPPAGIILLTDGIASGSRADRLSEAALLARDQLVPLYPVGIGSQEPARDVQLEDLLVDDIAFVGDPIVFSARIRSFGFAGQSAKLVLRENVDSEPVATKQISLPADGRVEKVEIVHVPNREGKFEFALEVEPRPLESDASNNRLTRTIHVRNEKIQVLLADSIPRYEFRKLKTLLERDKSIALSHVLQDADIEYASGDQTALEHFPVREEELTKYDVIIFGDVNPNYLGDKVLQSLQEFVNDGGGILFVAGERFNPLAYRNTDLEVLFPFDLSSTVLPSADMPIENGFRMRLTNEGLKGSTIFRLAETEEESAVIWRDLPEFFWNVNLKELKPGAVIFAEQAMQDAKGRNRPVIVMQRFGLGKTLYHTSDDFWRMGEPHYGRYWIQALRFVSQSKLLGRDRGANLTVDRKIYTLGDTVEFRVRVFDERLLETNGGKVTIMLERRGDFQREIALTPLPGLPFVFEGRFPQAAVGNYDIWISSPLFKGPPPRTDFRVMPPMLELEQRSMDEVDLRKAAKTSRGRLFTLADVDQLAQLIPPVRPVPLESQEPLLLWNRWELLIVFSLLLTAEWLLRKRFRLT